MKRRTFIKNTSLAVVGLATPREFPFLDKTPFNELVGKDHPKLFGSGHKLRLDAHNAFLKMKDAAGKTGINIEVVSSYRSFDHQKRIWTRKYNQNIKEGLSKEKAIGKIIEYSTIPGTSRHHWGTDIDIIDGKPKQPKQVLNPKHFTDNGPYQKLKLWMDDHSESFGFYLVYDNNPDRTGFKYEPWHYSYKPLSQLYIRELDKPRLIDLIKKEKLAGSILMDTDFLLEYYENYIKGINQKLL